MRIKWRSGEILEWKGQVQVNIIFLLLFDKISWSLCPRVFRRCSKGSGEYNSLLSSLILLCVFLCVCPSHHARIRAVDWALLSDYADSSSLSTSIKPKPRHVNATTGGAASHSVNTECAYVCFITQLCLTLFYFYCPFSLMFSWVIILLIFVPCSRFLSFLTF